MRAMISLPLRASLVAVAMAASTLAVVVASPVAAVSPAVNESPAATTAWFSSPSRNIACSMYTSGVRCDVLVHTYKPTRRPASCEADWGTAFEVKTTGKGHFRCVADSVNGPAPILKYGHSKSIGRFTCTSRTTGMTCIDRYNGHGFRASKSSYRLF
jgi:hypothetical protein